MSVLHISRPSGSRCSSKVTGRKLSHRADLNNRDSHRADFNPRDRAGLSNSHNPCNSRDHNLNSNRGSSGHSAERSL